MMKSEIQTGGIDDGKAQKTEEPFPKYVLIMYLDPDVKFVSINSPFIQTTGR